MERRKLFSLGAAGAAAVGGGFAAGQLFNATKAVADGTDAAEPVPFHGEHQAGITTPAQDRLHFSAFDVITDDRDELVGLLKEWTEAAARM